MAQKQQLSALIAESMTEFVIAYARILDKDLTAPQYYILQILEAEHEKSCSQIAGSLGVTLSAVTNLSGKLVSKGYVERIVPANDRRTVLLRITTEGREVVRRMDDKYEELMEGIEESLTAEELGLLIEAYRKIIAGLRRKTYNNQE